MRASVRLAMNVVTRGHSATIASASSTGAMNTHAHTTRRCRSVKPRADDRIDVDTDGTAIPYQARP